MSTKIDVQPERAYTEQYTEMLDQLYDKIESSARADVVFASPEKYNGLVIIPVASVGWRFGSGTGTRRQKEQKEAQRGMGVAGTMSVSPLGFIEVKEETARFRPIFAFDTLLKMQIIGGLIALGIAFVSRRQSVREGEKRRGPMFNVVFKPHTNIIARGGRARKPRRVSQPRLHLNRKRTRQGFVKQFRSKRTK